MQHFSGYCHRVCGSKMNAVEHSRHIDSDLIRPSSDYVSAVAMDRLENQQNKQSKYSRNISKASCNRSLTSTFNNQRRHWWKVCWVYNGNFLFDSLNPKPDWKSSTVKSSTVTSATLPRNLKISPSERYSQMPLVNSRCSSHNDPTMVTRSSSEHEHTRVSNCRPAEDKSEGHHAPLLESNSSTEAKQSLFSIPSQLKLIEKNFQKEMARICSQQLSASQLLQQRITHPLSSWTKTKSNGCKTNCGQFFEEYKGSQWRQQQLEYQMPIHDVQLFKQSTTESKFIRNKQRKALVKSELCSMQQPHQKCPKCLNIIELGVHCVKITLPTSSGANEVDDTRQVLNPLYNYYHIDCFTCFECEEILVDLKAYLYLQNIEQNANISVNYKLFCLRHFVEIYKPRCPHCDMLILDEECTEAEGKAWHIGHFCCTECKRSLGGKQYIMAGAEKGKHNVFKSKQMPYCLTCFDILYGELCEECGELIGCEVGAIVHEGRSWHASDICFRCSLCLKSLLGKPFLPAMDGRIYCSLTCSQAMNSHQKERIRRHNKLQTLHSPKKTTEKRIEQLRQIDQSSSNIANGSNIKPTVKSREDFLKSMTLDRYEQHTKNKLKQQRTPNSTEKLKILNLTQVVNYEEFIKKNNQCFTSKYDWSKEQEFLDVIDSNNEISSQTTATASDQNSEDNMILNFSLKCENGSSKLCNSLDRRHSTRSSTNSWSDFSKLCSNLNENFSELVEQNVKKGNNYNENAKIESPSQNGEIKLNLQSNPLENDNLISSYVEEKTSLLSSPSSSNETAPIWAVSPPPEYSKLLTDFKDESSSNSSFQNTNELPQNFPKSKKNGILKVNTSQPLIKVKSEAPCYKDNLCIESVGAYNINLEASQPICNRQYTQVHSTPLNSTNSLAVHCINSQNSHLSKSNSKSVSFDPTIEEKDESKPRSIRKLKTRMFEYEQDDCSDSHSCSSCSTCSSSSDDDEFDYDLSNLNQNNKYVATNRQNQIKRTQSNNEACTIS